MAASYPFFHQIGTHRPVPAGHYVLVTDEKPPEEQTFYAGRRISGYLIVGGPANPGHTELLPVTEAKLDGLVARNDAAPAFRQTRATR